MAPKRKSSGSNGGGNNQGGDDDDDDDQGVAFTDNQRTEITNLVNAAVSGQLQRKLPNAIKGAIDGPLGEIRTLLENQAAIGRRGAGAGDDDEDDDEEVTPPPGKRGKPAKGNRAPVKDPEVENLRKQVATLTTERQQERDQALARDRDAQLREHLTAAGVDPNRIRGAIAVLRDQVVRDPKTGDLSYKAKRDGFEEDLDVATGVGEWAATDEGKSYIAPAGTPKGGTGTRINPGNTGRTGVVNGGRPTADPKAAKAQAKQDAMAKLGEAIGSIAGGSTIGVG